MNARARSWTFTLNNYTEEAYNKIKAIECRYKIIGKEVGKNGTPHLQGYITFKNARTFSSMKKKLPGAHIEIAHGSPAQNRDYCSKDNNFIEEGDIPQQGKRTDLDEVCEQIIEGRSMEDLALDYPKQFVKFHKGFEYLKYKTEKDRTEKPIVTWLYGTTGVGKTYYPTNKHTSYYIKDGTQWWNGYSHEEAIIIDDFDGKWPYRDLLRLLDKYKYQGQTKGGYTKINSKYIYITCEHSPEYFWSANKLNQILRRIDAIYLINKDRSIELQSNSYKNDTLKDTEVAGNTITATLVQKLADQNKPKI